MRCQSRPTKAYYITLLVVSWGVVHPLSSEKIYFFSITGGGSFRWLILAQNEPTGAWKPIIRGECALSYERVPCEAF